MVKDLGRRGNKNHKMWTSKSVIKYLKCITILQITIKFTKTGTVLEMLFIFLQIRGWEKEKCVQS